MARKSKDTLSINRGLFSDIYEECCTTDAERMILDIIISHFLLKEVFKGDEATERAVAKITGLSKSGVRVVEGRAMAKMKDMLKKQGINKIDDIIDNSRGRTAVGDGSVDEKEQISEAKSRSITVKELLKQINEIVEDDKDWLNSKVHIELDDGGSYEIDFAETAADDVDSYVVLQCGKKYKPVIH